MIAISSASRGDSTGRRSGRSGCHRARNLITRDRLTSPDPALRRTKMVRKSPCTGCTVCPTPRTRRYVTADSAPSDVTPSNASCSPVGISSPTSPDAASSATRNAAAASPAGPRRKSGASAGPNSASHASAASSGVPARASPSRPVKFAGTPSADHSTASRPCVASNRERHAASCATSGLVSTCGSARTAARWRSNSASIVRPIKARRISASRPRVAVGATTSS